ncbi:hypothetical protein L484_028017 [Morus notabilis]|uniref:Uncharacterized protein n=1 Tax=Morus notabilis TaxID=981085 RepID=W9SFW2_9ROSA|nr:hypothetical protein L484_028017 [Morus notabilis]
MPLVRDRRTGGPFPQIRKGIFVHKKAATESEPAVSTINVTRHGVPKSDIPIRRPGFLESEFGVHLS